MTEDAFNVTVHMASSLDFFVASEDGNVAWLETTDTYEKGVTGEEAEESSTPIDCFVMGSHTYELALTLGWPYGDIPVIVLTSRNLSSDRKSVEFASGDPVAFTNVRLRPRFKNVWVVGGTKVASDFIRLNLADDLRLSIIPILLGGGTPFVEHLGAEHPLHLKDVTAYKNGIVGLWYEIRKG